MKRLICTRCGGDQVKVLEGRPSLDDRFAVGYCDRCTPVPIYDPATKRSKPATRGTVPLVEDTDKARDEIHRRDRLVRERKLVEKAMAGDARLTESQLAEARAIRQRWADEAEARRSA